ncbi:MAG: YceI family protein [Bacteroidetes bacterium]|nr:YceI family protein [Bacteroidota bacterium]
MKKYFALLILALILTAGVRAQAYVTKNGYIRFYSEAPMEKIEGINRQVNVAMLPATGDFVFKVLMKSFNFEKALMQEHFNENYVESDKYPEATFLGKITNIKAINFAKDGSYPAMVEGKLTIHGVTQVVKQNGTITINKDIVSAKAKFTLLLADYKISVPSTVVNNISKSLEITVDAAMEKLNK